MTIQERAEQAVSWKNAGVYNCCQAVLMALADQTGLEEAALASAASGFGVGMGTMESGCGALVGAGIAAGLRCGGQGTLRYTRQLADGFRSRCGAVVCKELKGKGTGVPLCSCENCVRNAVLLYGEVMGLE